MHCGRNWFEDCESIQPVSARCSSRVWVLPNKRFATQMVFVSSDTLLADAMKPLNVLAKFENHFANQTVRFQAQLEADGYFLDLPYFSCTLPKVTYSQKFAFAKRSGAMKAPMGLLSDRTVCDSRWRGVAPTSATPTRSLRKCRRIAEVKSRMDRTFSRIENLWPRDGSCPLPLRSKRIFNKRFRIVKTQK